MEHRERADRLEHHEAREPRELLQQAALRRGGVFTRTDLVDAGLTQHALRRELAAGVLKRLHTGVFVDALWYCTLENRDRHLVDLRARLLARGDGWHAARRSAAVVHGLPLLGDLPKVPLLVRDRSAASDRGYLRTERLNTVPAHDRDIVLGTPVTALARTVLDLAREESFRSALVVADAALHLGLPRSELVGALQRCRNWPGAAKAERVVTLADGLAESPLESISRAGFLTWDITPPELQVEVWDQSSFVARVDFLWRAQRVIGEADGRVKYASVTDLYAEKRREERLRDLGFEVVRWDWATAYHPERGLDAALGRAFARGALNTLAPGVSFRNGGTCGTPGPTAGR